MSASNAAPTIFSPHVEISAPAMHVIQNGGMEYAVKNNPSWAGVRLHPGLKCAGLVVCEVRRARNDPDQTATSCDLV